MEIHVRRFIIGELGKYELYCEQLADYERRRDEVAESYPSPELKPGRATTVAIADPTAQAAARLERLAANIARARFYVKAIDEVMNNLTERQKEVVRLRFIKRYNIAKVGFKTYLSESTIHRETRTALSLFAARMGL